MQIWHKTNEIRWKILSKLFVKKLIKTKKTNFLDLHIYLYTTYNCPIKKQVTLKWKKKKSTKDQVE